MSDDFYTKLQKDLEAAQNSGMVTKHRTEFYKWGTSGEITYLKRLGTWCEPDHHSGFTRLDLLLKYKASMTARVNWDGIDAKKVSKYLEKCIREEMNK